MGCRTMPEFQLTNDRRGTPRRSEFADNERSKQLMLLSGLDCLPGQLDLFDVDTFPKETSDDTETHPDRGRD